MVIIHIAKGRSGKLSGWYQKRGFDICKIIGWSLFRVKAHRSLPYWYTAHSKDVIIIAH